MPPIKMLLTLLLGASLVACAGGPQPQTAAAAATQPSHKEVTELKMIVFPGAFNWPLWAGMEKGFFARNGVSVKLVNAPTAAYQLQGVVNGTFEIALTPMDDLIAFREAPLAFSAEGNDAVAVMGADSGFLKLTAVPEVHTIADLRGKEVALDSGASGSSYVLEEILARNGLVRQRDYTTAFAGTLPQRYQLLLERKHAATMLVSPYDVVARQQGMNVLADAAGALGSYQGTVAVVRRSWAQENTKALTGFIRGYRQAVQWLYNPANREAAIAVLRANLESTPESLASAYSVLLDPVNGIDRNARVDEAGVRTVIQLREKYGKAKKLKPMSAYYDPRYYEAASP